MASRLHRLINIDAHIRAGSYPNVDTLCRMFEVQPRTLHQDIKELREHFQLDIRFDRTRGGYYNADPVKRLPSIALTSEQAFLTLAALEVLCHFGGDAFRGVLSTVIDTLSEGNAAATPERLSASICFNSAEQTAISPAIFYELLRACLEKRRVCLQLKPPGKPAPEDVQAQQLLLSEHKWWLVALAANGSVKIPVETINSLQFI